MFFVRFVKINKKTICIKYSETFKESIKANLLKAL